MENEDEEEHQSGNSDCESDGRGGGVKSVLQFVDAGLLRLSFDHVSEHPEVRRVANA